jgi:hypothetical protein
LIGIHFDKTIYLIKDIFNEGLKNTEFKRIHLFYTLFTSIYHTLFGLTDIDKPIRNIEKGKFEQVKLRLTGLNQLFETKNISGFPEKDIQFLEDSRRATTDAKVRIRRTEYLLDIINSI